MGAPAFPQPLPSAAGRASRCLFPVQYLLANAADVCHCSCLSSQLIMPDDHYYCCCSAPQKMGAPLFPQPQGGLQGRGPRPPPGQPRGLAGRGAPVVRGAMMGRGRGRGSGRDPPPGRVVRAPSLVCRLQPLGPLGCNLVSTM